MSPLSPGHPPTPRERVALLDLDGTLHPETLGLHLAEELVARGIIKPDVASALLPSHSKHLTGSEDYFTRASRFYDQLGQCIRGVTHTRIEEAAEAVWEREHARLFPHARSLVTALKDAGYLLVLVSGSPTEVVRLVAEDLGIPVHHSARCEVRRGRYTGRVLERTALPGGKRQALTALSSGRALDLESSFALGDAPSDAELMEQVGLAVAFEPEPELAAMAARHHWWVVDRHDILDVVLPLLPGSHAPGSRGTLPAPWTLHPTEHSPGH